MSTKIVCLFTIPSHCELIMMEYRIEEANEEKQQLQGPLSARPGMPVATTTTRTDRTRYTTPSSLCFGITSISPVMLSPNVVPVIFEIQMALRHSQGERMNSDKIYVYVIIRRKQDCIMPRSVCLALSLDRAGLLVSNPKGWRVQSLEWNVTENRDSIGFLFPTVS
jgi:hypothetical protein